MSRILVVDDQANMRATLALMLRASGHEIFEAENGEEAIKSFENEACDVVITDLKMGAMDGIDVLRHIQQASPLVEVIVMTAYGTIESAVEAIRLGAYDYIQKPFTEEELLVKIDKALERRWLSGEVSLLGQEFRARYNFENIIGRSPAIRDVLARVIRIAPTDATVLITGSSGTGKELIAKSIHANSGRSHRPFIPVNCAAISESLLESELFGHARGAFTGAVGSRKGLFEEADGGTFFFDEIAETSLSFQAKLLRAIQENEIRRVGDNRAIKVDVRIIAATNQDIKEAMDEKRFREDLYYRLNVARFHLPALNDRREDIPLLVEYFLSKACSRMRRRARLGEGVMQFLVNYNYVGNIRELENLIEQGVALSVKGVISLEDIRPENTDTETPRTLADIVASAERQAIRNAVRQNTSLQEAADSLGLSGTTLWRKMKKLGIRKDSFS